MNDKTHPQSPLLALSSELPELPEPLFQLNFRQGNYYVTKSNIGQTDCYTADQMRVYATEAAAYKVRDHSLCKFSTGICGATTAGTGNLDEYGYWEFPCDTCAMRMELKLQMSKVGELTDQVAYWKEMWRAANARGDGAWISVSDSTPPEDTPVWCSINGTEPWFGAYCYADGDEDDGAGWAWMRCDSRPYFLNGKWKCDDIEWDDQYDVTHWMHLPTPPTPGSEVKS